MRAVSSLLLFSVLLLGSASSQAAEKAQEPTPAPASKAPASKAEKEPQTILKTLVLRVEARRKVDPELALALEGVVQSTLATDRQREVFGQEDLRRVFEFESERQSMGCTDASCLAELANVMNADRLVLGTMDKMGKSYLIGLTEIDGKSLKPVGRVQKTIPAKEEQLISGVEKLTVMLMGEKFLKKAAPLAASEKGSGRVTGFAMAGSVKVQSVPTGATIIVGGEKVGKTPMVVHNLQVGDVELRLERKNYRPLVVEVPVFQSKETSMKAELLLLKKKAQKAHHIKMNTHNKKMSNLRNLGCGKLVCGGLVCAGSSGAFAGAEASVGSATVGAGMLALGTALGLWGGLDLFKKVEAPKPDWELPRQVRVNPPKGLGKVKVKKTLDLVKKKKK
ncbi:MAG: hypothetical protein CMH56_13105 [Myxococcales bacterium]|nr:hypothetical protein [Myxococcales bacterium]